MTKRMTPLMRPGAVFLEPTNMNKTFVLVKFSIVLMKIVSIFININKTNSYKNYLIRARSGSQTLNSKINTNENHRNGIPRLKYNYTATDIPTNGETNNQNVASHVITNSVIKRYTNQFLLPGARLWWKRNVWNLFAILYVTNMMILNSSECK